MFRCLFTVMLFGIALAACSRTQYDSGIEMSNFDRSINPQDDFYRYVNGTWLAKTEIPADKSNYGAFTELFEANEKRLKEIVEEAAKAADETDDPNMTKVGDFYLSYMDTTLVEELGLKPIEDEMARIEAIRNKKDIIKQFAHFQRIGAQTPLYLYVNQDLKNSTEYIGYLHQSGLGLPDRSYYLKPDEKFREIRENYVDYIGKILTLADQENAAQKADRIMEMEAKLAEHHWTRVENRDRDKTYNKFEMSKLKSLAPEFDWGLYYASIDIPQTQSLIIRQPSYLEGFSKLLNSFSVADWKAYFTYKLINSAADLLSHKFVDTKFEFYGKTLRGIDENRPRWKRAISALNEVLGEVLGKIFVKKYFKPEAKARMNEMVENLKKAYKNRIENLDWMTSGTRAEALKKLAKFNSKIGYPDKWKDYSKLTIKRDELVQNYKRYSEFEFQRMIDKLGKPIDRDEWFMNPQTVNAYYNPPMNEVVFPAAILQPPFFNMAADDAANYGAIGTVIGHELTHGFDDQGRKSDGNGNLRDWWSKKDTEEFQKRAQVMVEQYNKFNPIDTMHVNGKLTLGENIADLGGLTISYNAYQLSLNGTEAPLIEGLTGDQRFFLGYAQIWRRKYREEELRRRILTDSHSPAEYRVNGILANMPEFYEAFDVKEGDKLYREAEQMVQIW